MNKKTLEYEVHKSSYIDENVKIGKNTKIYHFCHIQNGASIGSNCTLGQNVNIGEDVVVGDNVKIQNNVSVYSGVSIEDDVFLGPSCVFTNDLNPRSTHPKGKDKYLKTIVKKGATIGANATIVCGNTIGSYALIAAGSVVTRDVPEYALMVGIPAKKTAFVCECGNILKHGYKCDKCLEEYELKDGILIKKT